MIVCLFKKVTIQKNTFLTEINCNHMTNFMAIGGEDGFLKVVQIDLNKSKKNEDGTAVSPLTFSQNLSCHKKRIISLTWNSQVDKLTTCDEEGVIVVWKFTERDQWETEMINNREVSFVSDLKWSKMGNYLCFVYDDGHAIVGTSEGSRSWGNDVKQGLYLVEWSPDESLLLFCVLNHNITVFSASGYQVGEMEIPQDLRNVKIATISWWSSPYSESLMNIEDKHLVIAFINGTILLYDNHQDLDPIRISSEHKKINKAQWNPNGDILAVSGIYVEKGEKKESINFYSWKNLELLTTIKIPNQITCFCWESHGTKLAITTESFILFCLVKPKYKWCYFSDTLVYSYKTNSEHHTVIFWDVKKNIRNFKYVKNLRDIVSYGSFCLLTAQVSDKNYIAILCNSIGSPVDNRIINICPEFTAINRTHAIVASKHYVYVWQFRNPTSNDLQKYYGHKINIDLLKRSLMKEIAFFLEENPNMKDNYILEHFTPTKTSNDPITSLCANGEFIIVACESGRGLKYTLSDMSSSERISIGTRLIRMGISNDGVYLWGIDDQNYLGIWDLTKDSKSNVGKLLKGQKIDFDKKDVWTVIWSNDSKSFAFIEKNKLTIYKNFEVEETLQCNGHLAEFSDLTITAVMLEDLLVNPTVDKVFEVDDIVIKCETLKLRNLREMIEAKKPMNELFQFVEQNSHDKFWTILTEHSMLSLDFITAEKCLIKYQDFMGLILLKRLKTIDDDMLKKAEIYQHFFEYDKAEEIYNSLERKDLIINMRIKLGHWNKVIHLIQESSVIQEDNLKVACNNLALQHVENKEFDKAEELFFKTNNREELVNVWFKTENFDKASEYIDQIPEESDFLLFMGEKFELYGLTEEAVKCYIRYGDIKRAIDICVLMNKWNLAVDLAHKHGLFQIEGLVNKFCNILIEKNKKMDLVEFYRKAQRNTEAAKILIKIAEELKALNASPIILKKIYVVAALEMESFKTRYIDAQITNTMTSNQQNTQTLDTLITSEMSNVSDKALNNPWKGAEAFHYYMLCQNQLYNK